MCLLLLNNYYAFSHPLFHAFLSILSVSSLHYIWLQLMYNYQIHSTHPGTVSYTESRIVYHTTGSYTSTVAGYIEVRLTSGSAWLRVTDDGWTSNDYNAQPFCKAAGHQGGLPFSAPLFGTSGSGDYYGVKVSCDSDAAAAGDPLLCDDGDVTPGTGDAGVYCWDDQSSE